MKERLTKIIVTLAAIALVVPFVCVALLIGTRAVAGAASMSDDLLLVALALTGAAASVVKNMRRTTRTMSRDTSLHITATHARRGRAAFLSASSSN